MPLYRLAQDRIEALSAATFAELGIRERSDLQRVLKDNLGAIAPDSMVLCEEFSQWEESKRRIDLLALDRSANLVVVELKRDEDGGHMELQALRYAAMVSTMTFDDAVETHARYLSQRGVNTDARTSILEFLGWKSPDEGAFAEDVRIVLASADFSRELTTAVLWLNGRDLDIRCVRVRPYRLGTEIVLDVHQAIPLPEAEDYQVQLRQKVREERARTDAYRDFTRYDLQIDDARHENLSKREFVFRVVRHAISRGATPKQIADTIQANPDRIWRHAPGRLGKAQFIAAVAAQATKEGRQFDPGRFFTEDDELIQVQGHTYAFTNQWGGPRVIEAVDALIGKFGTEDIRYNASPTPAA